MVHMGRIHGIPYINAHCCFRAMIKDDIFLKNNVVVVFLLFFLFIISMVGFAFMISTLINKSSSTTSIGSSIHVLGIVTVLLSFVLHKRYAKNILHLMGIFFCLILLREVSVCLNG